MNPQIKGKTMESYANGDDLRNGMEEEFEDTLSLCDLSLCDKDQESDFFPSTQEDDHLFEFSTDPKPYTSVDSFIFCGKTIPRKTQKPIITSSRNSVFPLVSPRSFNKENRSMSLHVEGSKPTASRPLMTRSFRSGNSRKHYKVLIGLAKIPPTMELSDIKRRQNRQTSKPAFPLGEKEGINGAGNGGSLARPFKCRDYLARAVASCLPFIRG